MAEQHTYEQLRNMAESGTSSQKDTIALMAAVVSDIAEKLNKIQDAWVVQDEIYDKRFKALESHEKRNNIIIGIFGSGLGLTLIYMIDKIGV